MTRFRRAGSRWRLLVHRMRPLGGSGAAVSVLSHPSLRRTEAMDPAIAEKLADGDARFSVDQVIAGCEFDELVVGEWLHVEQMDAGFWWMSVGGLVLHVRADRDGRPTHVRVDTTPDVPVEGCRYVIDDEEVAT